MDHPDQQPVKPSTFPLQRTWAGLAAPFGALFLLHGIATRTPSTAVMGAVGIAFAVFVLSSRLVLDGTILRRRLAGRDAGAVDLLRLEEIEVLPDNRPRLTLVDEAGGRLRIRPKNYAREGRLRLELGSALPEGSDDGWLTTAF